MWRILLIAVGIPSPVRADTALVARWGGSDPELASARLRLEGIEDGAIDRVSIVLRSDGDGVFATLGLVLTTNDETGRDLALPFTVSTGAEVVGMTVAIGTGGTLVAHASERTAARAAYDEIVRSARDPALIEWRESTKHGSGLVLRTFPVTKDTPATVTIQIAFPPARRFVLDAGDRPIELQIENDGVVSRRRASGTQTLTLPARGADWMSRDPIPRSGVDRETSLFAGFAVLDTQLVARRFQARLPPRRSATRRDEVAAALRRHAPALGHCYAYGVERDPYLVGSGRLSIRIEADGTVRETRLDGDLAADADVRWCILEEVRSWTFRATEIGTTIASPIELPAPR